jgi:RNA polymerase sigma factor (sigma-70 family)
MEKERMCSLVTRVQQGDPEAAGDLYLESRDDLYYYIMKTVNDPQLAEDLLQDSFMEILETIGKLKEPAAYVVWSRQIAYHRCTGYFRKRHELLADENEDGQTVFDTVQEDRAEFIPDQALEKEDLKATIGAMIDSLPEEQRSALLLRYFDELSVEEIAKIQNVPVGTVKSRLNYGRKQIKSAVETYEKKSGVKLHSVAILPVLLWFFREKAISSGASLTAKGAAAVATAAVDTGKVALGAEAARLAVTQGAKTAAGTVAKTAAGTVAKTTAGTVAKSAAKGAATRLIASVAATALISSAGTALVMHKLQDDPAALADTTATTQYILQETELPTETTAPADVLPAPGSAWEGFGACSSYNRWFDMTLGAMTETEISGSLVLTLGPTTYHSTGFSGTGTADGDKITYHITLDTPHLLSDMWDLTLESLDLVYDRQQQTFTMDDQYDVILRDTAKRQEQTLTPGSWSGYGSDDSYLGLGEDHLFNLTVDKLTTVEISGHLTLTYQGLVDHDTGFTGRCRPRDNGGGLTYDLVLDTPRIIEGFGGPYVLDGLTLIYDPGTDTFSFAGLQFYEAEMTKA